MKKLLTLAIIAMLILTGCDTVKNRLFSKPADVPKVEDYLIGKQGLKIEFLTNNPPKSVFSGDDFPVKIRLSNIGATTIEKNAGYLVLSYFDPEVNYTKNKRDFQIIKDEIRRKISKFETGILKGKDKFNPQGNFYDESYQFVAEKLPQEKIGTLLRVNACYKYNTRITEDICINPIEDPKLGDKQFCNPNKIITTISGQGAPVEISKIVEKTTVLPDKGDQKKKIVTLRFDVYVKNSGGGNIYDKEVFDFPCLGKKGLSEVEREIDVKKVKNKIYIDEVRFSGYSTLNEDKKITCATNNQFTMKEFVDSPAFSCSVILNEEEGQYTTPLIIDLSYGYETETKKVVTINKKS